MSTSVPPALDLVEHEVFDVVTVRSSNGQVVARESFPSRVAAARGRRRWRNTTTEAREVRVERVQFRTAITTTVIR